MAGLGRKTFVATEVLTAANVNGYLMDQTVMKFADSTARSSAIGTAVSEGMVSYLADTDALEVYNGSAWAAVGAATGSGNAIINGAFEINQRNLTSSTVAGWYGFDRWNNAWVQGTGTVTHSAQTFTPGTAPVAGYEGTNFVRFVTTGQTAAGDYASIRQPVENVRTFAGQTVTISFWAKAATGTPAFGVTLDQNFGSGGSASVKTNATFALTTSWARYSATLNLPSISGKTIGTGSFIDVYLFGSVGTTISGAGYAAVGLQNNTFDIWGVQLEAGSSATPFKRNAPSIQGELAACQRYYWLWASGNGSPIGMGSQYSNTQLETNIQYPVTMRATPSLVQVSGTNYYLFQRNNGADNFDSWTGATLNNQTANLYNNTQISGTAGQTGTIWTNNASSSLAFSAEL